MFNILRFLFGPRKAAPVSEQNARSIETDILSAEISLAWKTIGNLQRDMGTIQRNVEALSAHLEPLEKLNDLLSTGNNADIFELKELHRLFGSIDAEIESIVRERTKKRLRQHIEAGALRALHAVQLKCSDKDSYGATKGDYWDSGIIKEENDD